MTVALAPAGLPLTRRALTAYPRWRESAGLARRSWEQACGLHPHETRALETLDVNLRACGETRGWFKDLLLSDRASELHLREGIAETLCRGLTVDERGFPELIRACGVRQGWPAQWLERGIRKHLALPEPEKKRPEKAEPSITSDCAKLARGGAQPDWIREPLKPRERKEQPMETMSNGKSSVFETPFAAPRVRGVAEELDRRGVDLADAVNDTVKREIAAVLGTTRGTVEVSIGTIRKQRGIPTPARGVRTPEPPPRSAVRPAAHLG